MGSSTPRVERREERKPASDEGDGREVNVGRRARGSNRTAESRRQEAGGSEFAYAGRACC